MERRLIRDAVPHHDARPFTRVLLDLTDNYNKGALASEQGQCQMKEGFMESISIAGDLFFPSDEKIVWLLERYDLVVEEICEANANPPGCRVYFKPDGRITEYASFPDWGWERGEPLAPNVAVFISSETEGETVERIKAAAEKSGRRILKTDFQEMDAGCWDKPGRSCQGTSLSGPFSTCSGKSEAKTGKQRCPVRYERIGNIVCLKGKWQNHCRNLCNEVDCRTVR